jgi:AraC family transcriptional regulator
MSKQHFIRTFTEKYQTTPIKYLNIFRIVTAQRLLESNTMNVSDVFKSCGFNSSAHFSRAFKQITGMSPKAYQLKFKNKKE